MYVKYSNHSKLAYSRIITVMQNSQIVLDFCAHLIVRLLDFGKVIEVVLHRHTDGVNRMGASQPFPSQQLVQVMLLKTEKHFRYWSLWVYNYFCNSLVIYLKQYNTQMPRPILISLHNFKGWLKQQSEKLCSSVVWDRPHCENVTKASTAGYRQLYCQESPISMLTSF